MKETNLFQNLFQEYRNYTNDRKDELQSELLFFIKENGLTIRQAKELFTDTINSLEYFGTILTVADYKRITGRDVKGVNTLNSSSKKPPKKKKSKKPIGKPVNVSYTVPSMLKMILKKSSMKDL